MISARILLDSISPQGFRLTTYELRYPKGFIHGECKTHRRLKIGNEGAVELFQEVGFMDDPKLSRNASSSRAIPTAKYLEEVRSDELRAGPIYWGKNISGMGAREELSGDALISAQQLWKQSALAAADFVERMTAIGGSKEWVNRALDAYIHINVVCTATDYSNFFGLRLDRGAQPEIRRLAELMWAERQTSTPTQLAPGQWHLPYIDDDTRIAFERAHNAGLTPLGYKPENLIKVSVARCARVSYRSFETGKISTFEEDLKLYDRLVGAQPLHASPAEHQATPDMFVAGLGMSGWSHLHEHGNLTGWRQYRKMIPGESCAPLPKEYQ